jgi:hypothetical protein
MPFSREDPPMDQALKTQWLLRLKREQEEVMDASNLTEFEKTTYLQDIADTAEVLRHRKDDQ